MSSAISVVVLRHPKERLSKCSLAPLCRNYPEITFHLAKPGFTFDASHFIVLGLGYPALSEKDWGLPLLLLDSTWRLLPQLEKCIVGTPIFRTLPEGVKTAYPRVSKMTQDPLGGLASIEALYLAKKILGEEDPALLNEYRWKEAFLAQFKSGIH